MKDYSTLFWKKIIEHRPNLIVYFSGYRDDIYQLALDKGYVIKEKDLIRSDHLCSSLLMMRKAIEIDPNFIKYFRPNYFSSDLEKMVEDAIKSGYRPDTSDLEKNPLLGYSKYLINYLIENGHPEAIRYFRAYNITSKNPTIPQIFEINNVSEIIKKYQPTFEDLVKNPSLGCSLDIMKNIVQEHPEAIKYLQCRGNCEEIINEALKYYKPTVEDVKRSLTLANSTSVFRYLIAEDPNNILYYDGLDEEVFKLALENNFKPKVEDLDKKFNFCNSISIMKYLIAKYDSSLVLKYISEDESVFEYAYNYGFNEEKAIDFLKSVKIRYDKYFNSVIKKYENSQSSDVLYNIFHSKFYFMKVLAVDPSLLEYYNGNDPEVFEMAFSKGFRPSENYFKSNLYNKNLFIVALKYFPDCISLYDPLVGDSGDVFLEAIRLNIVPSEKQIISLISYYRYLDTSDEFFLKLVILEPSYIKFYQGSNQVIYSYASSKGFYSENGKYDTSKSAEIDKVVKAMSIGDFSLLDSIDNEIKLNNKYLFYLAIELGYLPKSVDFRFIDLAEYKKQVLERGGRRYALSIILRLNLDADFTKTIEEKYNIYIPPDYVDLLPFYNGDGIEFIDNFSKYKLFLEKTGISEKQFIQYAFSTNVDWFSCMLKIVDENKLDDFVMMKDAFFDNYYFKNQSDISDVASIKAFLNILVNYNKYYELCSDIIAANFDVDSSLADNLSFLFNCNDIFSDDKKPKTLMDLSNVDQLFIEKYQSELSDINTKDINDIKNILCHLLFNSSLEDINSNLLVYGDTKNLRQLLFNNRDNPSLCDDITEIMIYTSMMEAVVFSNDREYLLSMVGIILDNFKSATKCMMLFSNFEEKMRSLYERELLVNLTALKSEELPTSVLDLEMTEKVGVDVIDFSNRKYCLMEHVMSESETVDELVNGESSDSHSTICISLGSQRCQLLYGYGSRTIFATDSLPIGSFVRSSTSNMGSNGDLKKNSFEISDSFKNRRRQRGALETSSAPQAVNSEVLCFREGIKFKYIVLLGGREPTEEEIEIAKKYNLKFIKVQEHGKAVDNPTDIPEEAISRGDISDYSVKIDELLKLREKLIMSKSKRPRQIAIFADSHGLFEPTLAILEDARKSGIDEIYSLGDNIGTGPNPRQVMELLEEYHVKSLKGNHELYATIGVDYFKGHFDRVGGYRDAVINSGWTRTKLTPEQLARIREMPEQMVIEIGGKKILLTHTVKDYNTDAAIEVSEDIDHTFQGHIHFQSETEGLHTLRGAGIGERSGNSDEAYYIVLTEKPGGGYDIEERRIPFDRKSTLHDIFESDMESYDKNKIQSWVGDRR